MGHLRPVKHSGQFAFRRKFASFHPHSPLPAPCDDRDRHDERLDSTLSARVAPCSLLPEIEKVLVSRFQPW